MSTNSFLSFLLFIVPTILSSCNNDEDCYLRGSCIENKCVCDYWAIGNNCEYLNLLPINKSQMGYINSSGISSWGGNIIYEDGKYHLFAAQFVNYCYVTSYRNSSEIIRAESSSPFGPFVMKEVIFPVFAHNPQIVQASDGTILLYYIGATYSSTETLNCTNNTRSHQFSITDHSYPNVTNDSNSIEMPLPGEGPINMAWSKSVYGPWNTKIIVDNLKEQWSTNPGPYIFPNDSVILAVRKRCNGAENYHNNKCANYQSYADSYIMGASHWNGTYKNISLYPNGQLFDCEDDFIFKTKRGYHMLQHYDGSKFGAWFAWSHDGIDWNHVKINTYNATIYYTDGTKEILCSRERPQIYFDENGDFVALFNGAMKQYPNCPYGNTPTFTLAQSFAKNDKSSHLNIRFFGTV
eukprot:425469_1